MSIPLIGDGDTGFGSAQNIKRTVQGYARAGFAGIMLEDQVAPKRCGHTEGKVGGRRDEALTRIRAAVDARDAGADILIMARTDARAASASTKRSHGAGCSARSAPTSRSSRRRSNEERDATLLRARSTARRWPT